jgi:uncharacterized damage-inducible protein DinB
MPETPASLAEKLTREGEKLYSYLSELSESQWQTTIYAEGSEWTARSILAHLVTAEKAFLKLFENVRQGGPGAAEDFDVDRYNASQQTKTRDLAPAELLEQFQSTRAEMVKWTSSLEQADLAKRGRHAAMGITSIEEMLKMVYLHNQMHLRDLKKAIK